MKMTNKFIRTSLSVLLLASLPMAVSAKSVTVVGTVLSGPVAAIQGSTSATAGSTATSATILGANFGVAGQGYTNGILNGVKGELESQTEVLNKLEDLAADNAYYLEKASKTEEIDREVRLRSGLVDLCISATAARAAQSAEKKVSEIKTELAERSSQRGVGTLQPEAVAERAAHQHANDFCSAIEDALGRCPNGISETPNADIKASTLYGGAKEISQTAKVTRDSEGNIIKVHGTTDVVADVSSDRLTFKPIDNTASILVIDNSINPIPDKVLDGDFSDPNNPNSVLLREYQTKLNARQTRLSFANNALNKHLSNRQPTIELAAWKEELAKAGGNADDAKEGMTVDGKISVLDKLKFDVDRRHKSATWYKKVAKKTNHELLVEMAVMDALTINLLHKIYTTLESIEGIASVQLADQINPITKGDLAQVNPAGL